MAHAMKFGWLSPVIGNRWSDHKPIVMYQERNILPPHSNISTSLVEWAVQNDLEVIDLTTDPAGALKMVAEAGLRIGSIDLPDNKGMIAADAGRRAEALARNSDCIRACYGRWPPELLRRHASRKSSSAARRKLWLYG